MTSTYETEAVRRALRIEEDALAESELRLDATLAAARAFSGERRLLGALALFLAAIVGLTLAPSAASHASRFLTELTSISAVLSGWLLIAPGGAR